MKKKMIKVLWIFLIFALTSNTNGFASAIDCSLSIASFPVALSDYTSSLDSPLKRGARGVFFNFHISQFPFEKGVSRRGTQAGLGSRDGVFSYSPYKEGRECVLNCYSRKSGNPFFNIRPAFRWRNPCRNLKIKSFHPAKKLTSSGTAIADSRSSSLTFNCISVDSIQQFQVSSNNLSDIFIPPK